MPEVSEYVQMLIAAGWVDAGSLDDEYQRYLKASHGHQEYDMDYEEWQQTVRDAEEAGKAYDAWCEANQPFQSGKFQPSVDKKAQDKLNDLCAFDYWLRH